MSQQTQHQSTVVLAGLDSLLPDLESLYKDFHSHPELSMQEKRTADLAAQHLRAAGYNVTTGIGKTGVVGVLQNGDGPVVMLRADMDALPVREGNWSALCEQRNCHRPRRQDRTRHACLWPRYACHLARGSGNSVRAASGLLARHPESRCFSRRKKPAKAPGR